MQFVKKVLTWIGATLIIPLIAEAALEGISVSLAVIAWIILTAIIFISGWKLINRGEYDVLKGEI